MKRPKQYLSCSQMVTVEMSPEKYVEKYIYGKKERISRNMAKGSEVSDSLKEDEMTGDPVLDLVLTKVPKFELRDQPVTCEIGQTIFFERDKTNIMVPVLENKKDPIPLLAVPDTHKQDLSKFKEYKSSVRGWTQKMADDSSQVTFYATTMWLLTKKIPNDIELVNILMEYQNGEVVPTGEIKIFKTERTLADVIKMTARMRRAWETIKNLTEKELL